ncbi:Vacuolar protein sorting-associated protein 20 [Thelotrema lepadinum]|nr:Vacuolar protein sorting-associated protein 20 [Thelotrema lepadinum]
MGNLSSTNKVSAQDRYRPQGPDIFDFLTSIRAILDLKIQRDKIQQYQKKLMKVTDRETEIAKQCLRNGQKSRALLALRRKKFQESLLAKTDLQLEQLQRLVTDVEFASVQTAVLYGLQQGTAVLKQIDSELGGIARVEKLMEDNAEARAYQREISDMLGGQLSNQDEDEVEDELAAVAREVMGLQAAEEAKLPDAPTSNFEAGQQQNSRRERAKVQEEQHAELLPA